MKCINCGAMNLEEALFCQKCGKRLETLSPDEFTTLSSSSIPPVNVSTSQSSEQQNEIPSGFSLPGQPTNDSTEHTPLPPPPYGSPNYTVYGTSEKVYPPPPPSAHHEGIVNLHERQPPHRTNTHRMYLIVIAILVIMLISAGGVLVGILVEKGNTQGNGGNTSNTPNQSGTTQANGNPTITTVPSTPTSSLTPTATPSPTPIPPLFSDHFDGTSLNSTRWTRYTNGGAINVSNSSVTLSTDANSQTFPYVYATDNPFPQTGNFSAKIVFQYLSSGPNGDGIVFDTGIPQNGAANRFSSWVNPVLILWQDTSAYGTLVAQIGNGNIVWRSNGVDTSLHTIVFNYINGEASVSVDGGRFSNPVAIERPTTMWFGNASQSSASPWSSFLIDLIQVTSND